MISLNKTIGFRLLRLVFGCYFAIAVAVTSVQLVAEYLHVKQEIFFEMAHLGDTLKDSLAQALWNYNVEQVEVTLLGISKIAMVSGTRVEDTNDELVAKHGLDLQNQENLSVSKEETDLRRGTIHQFDFQQGDTDKTIFEYQFPVHYVDENGSINEKIGLAYIYADHQVIIDRIKYGFILIIVNSLIKTLALWLVFLYFTKRIIAKPLGSLTQAARQLDPSNLDTFRNGDELEKLSNSGHDDELQVLTQSFVKMRNAVVEKIDVIEEQNSTLEQRVAKRTENLTQSNQELAQEIEQRRRAEESLRIYREIIFNTDEAIVVTDPDGTILEVNPAYERNIGFSRDELIGSKHGTLGTGCSDADFEQEMRASIEQCSHWRGEIHATKKDGESVPLWIAINAIHDENGGIQHLIGLMRDVSELKQTEARLAQAQKLESIGQLAAGVAHEINTPTQFVGDNIHFLQGAFEDLLGVQNAYGKLLEAARSESVTPNDIEQVDSALEEADSEYLAEEIPSAIEQSVDGVRRIAKIVGAMKAFSHMGSDTKELADLNTAIANTITVARNEWKYLAEIELELEENLPQVPCYPAEFNQVVLNLVVNAAHAIKDAVDTGAGQKGLITITSRSFENGVEVRIRDNGSGIPEAARDKIFDPFFTTKEVGKGTGQGLSLAHTTVVDKHGGTLNFETETGKGTTFVITLPLDDNQAVEDLAVDAVIG